MGREGKWPTAAELNRLGGAALANGSASLRKRMAGEVVILHQRGIEIMLERRRRGMLVERVDGICKFVRGAANLARRSTATSPNPVTHGPDRMFPR
jgi:hypothetical protein